MIHLQELIARVPPPPRPRFGTLDWEQVFAELGTRLPADYVAFIDTYGSVEFGGFLGIADPREAEPPSYHRFWCEEGGRYRRLKEQFPDFYPLTPWPESCGFLGWGNDIDANWFGWVTEGDPDQWPVAVRGRQMEDGVVGPVTMTEFLSGWLSHPPAYAGLPDLTDEDDPGHIDCCSW